METTFDFSRVAGNPDGASLEELESFVREAVADSRTLGQMMEVFWPEDAAYVYAGEDIAPALLIAYCIWAAKARRARLRGCVMAAQCFEQSAQSIYELLPEFAKW
jgi:hypothetical protein